MSNTNWKLQIVSKSLTVCTWWILWETLAVISTLIRCSSRRVWWLTHIFSKSAAAVKGPPLCADHWEISFLTVERHNPQSSFCVEKNNNVTSVKITWCFCDRILCVSPPQYPDTTQKLLFFSLHELDKSWIFLCEKRCRSFTTCSSLWEPLIRQ